MGASGFPDMHKYIHLTTAGSLACHANSDGGLESCQIAGFTQKSGNQPVTKSGTVSRTRVKG